MGAVRYILCESQKKRKKDPPLCNLQKGGRLIGLECYKRTCVICGLVDLILVVFEGLFESVPDAVQHAAIKVIPPFDDHVVKLPEEKEGKEAK